MKKYFVLLAVLALVFQPSLLLAEGPAKKADPKATKAVEAEEGLEDEDFEGEDFDDWDLEEEDLAGAKQGTITKEKKV